MIRSKATAAFRFLCLVGVATMALALSEARAQQTFNNAEAAADALAAAARTGDRKQIVTVLGPGSADIVSSGDDVQDDETRKAFVTAYDAKHSIKQESGKPATLLIGQGDFPFPIPLVEKNGSWSFDTKAGREEILFRRIGRNELAAIQASLAYVDAQNEYADMTKTPDGMAVYAQKIVSSPGKKDGLYWPAAQGEPESPLGEAVAEATTQGYRVGTTPIPFHGYYYKILTRQGPTAPGGAVNYVVGGNMVGGFALVAYPAEYGNSGVMTFVVNHNGNVFQKDLGPNTRQIAQRMTAFNPDHTWKKVVETEEVK
ncbi:MAG: DUF2950 domain-containing protein [Pseudomonadota bacterium]